MAVIMFPNLNVIIMLAQICTVYSANIANLTAFPGVVTNLTSPNYPSNYYDNADLQWMIASTSGFIVKVTIWNANLQIDRVFVQVFDGMSTSSPTLDRVYSLSYPMVYYSSGQYMYIWFFSDWNITYSGFELTYEAIPISGMCSAQTNLSAVPGQVSSLTSPSYPSNYYNNADCGQLIIAPISFVFKVNVMDVSLELNYDFVQIFDGMSTSSPPIVKFYSMPNQRVYYSTGQFMYVRFHTDVSVVNSGFRLTYKAIPTTSICPVVPGNFTAVPGELVYLTSPNYPSNYDNNTDCGQVINTSNGFVIKVVVTKVSLQVDFDFVQMFDGDSTSSQTLVKFYSMPNQTVYYSSGQYMYIRFFSDESVTFSGFGLVYEAIPTSGMCAVTPASLSAVTREINYLTSPSYPSNYYINADCGRLIIASDGSLVKVVVMNVSLQLNYDFVQIFDGMYASSPTIVKLYSMPNQTVYYTSRQYMYIRFFSDESVTFSGFNLSYEAIPTSDICAVTPANLSAVPGQVNFLTSPNYPSDYYTNADCRQLIIAPVGFVVKVDVTNVFLELNFDFVQIFDGMSTSSPTLVTFYSMPNQTVYYSSGQYMYIRFFSDVSVMYSGFRLTYEAVSQQPVATTAPTTSATTTEQPRVINLKIVYRKRCTRN